VRETAYIHLLFDKQEVLWANGAETESFHPASASLEMVDRAQRAALLARFPHLGQDPAAYGEFARRALDRAEAEILLFDTALRH
jgi:hypothetical protein